jgi:hypothetical protein
MLGPDGVKLRQFEDTLMADSENKSEDREESELIGRSKVLLQIAQKKGHCHRKLREEQGVRQRYTEGRVPVVGEEGVNSF